MFDEPAAHIVGAAVNDLELDRTVKASLDRSHKSLKCGDTDPEMNKVIKELVICSEFCIVYLTEDLSIEWRTTDDHKPVKYDGKILGRATMLETQSRFIEDKATLEAVRLQIAESIARCLEGDPEAVSVSLLNAAELQIADRNKEIAWLWYFTAAYQVTGVCAVLAAVLWLARDTAWFWIGHTTFDVVLGTFGGALGALLSTTSRGGRLVLDANAGKMVHQLEGLSRIGAGLIGALMVALSIKGGIIVSGVRFLGSPLAAMLVFCIAAGASERLVPSLVQNIERTALGRATHPSS